MDLIKLFFLIILFSSSFIQKINAEETDQFTLPPEELADIGPVASQKLFEIIESVVNQTNLEIQMFSALSQTSKHAATQLALRLDDSYLADLIYKKNGPGFPRWLRWNSPNYKQKPIQYREIKPWNTVYWLAFSQSPLSFIGLSPTINMYGHYFGTDKLGHFFMQGHTYYTIYKYGLAHWKSIKKAHQIMIVYGQVLEQTYLGTLVNGIYSNADLSANYAGWKFYMNLAHRIRIGNHTRSPILVLKGHTWEFSKQVKKDTLLQAYLSDNLSEAWNPCRYSFTRGQIQRQVKKRCNSWIAQKHITPQLIQSKLQETSLWQGESYGHWLPKDQSVSLAACFE